MWVRVWVWVWVFCLVIYVTYFFLLLLHIEVSKGACSFVETKSDIFQSCRKGCLFCF
jgi:hypothetical protein